MDSDTTAVLQELTEARTSLELERAKRMAADSIAEERRLQLEKAQAMVADLSAQLAERFKAMDLFATKILEARTERQPAMPYKLDRLPQTKPTVKKPQVPTVDQIIKFYKGQKPDAQKYPGIAAAMDNAVKDNVQ